MKQFTINDLYASAWQNAVTTVAKILGRSTDKEAWWIEIEDLCETLGLRFDENGNIIR